MCVLVLRAWHSQHTWIHQPGLEINLVAIVAQLVEQLICNQPVGGSSPLNGLFLEKI